MTSVTSGTVTAPFQLVVVNPVTAERTVVATDAQDLVWPAAVYARYNRGVYQSKLDEPNGATHVSTDDADRPHADITFLDAPLLMSLLFQNTRSRRLIPSGGRPFRCGRICRRSVGEELCRRW